MIWNDYYEAYAEAYHEMTERWGDKYSLEVDEMEMRQRLKDAREWMDGLAEYLEQGEVSPVGFIHLFEELAAHLHVKCDLNKIHDNLEKLLMGE